jgi:hypothetical protein
VLGWHHAQGWLPADGINACRADTAALLIDVLPLITGSKSGVAFVNKPKKKGISRQMTHVSIHSPTSSPDRVITEQQHSLRSQGVLHKRPYPKQVMKTI